MPEVRWVYLCVGFLAEIELHQSPSGDSVSMAVFGDGQRKSYYFDFHRCCRRPKLQEERQSRVPGVPQCAENLVRFSEFHQFAVECGIRFEYPDFSLLKQVGKELTMIVDRRVEIQT